MITTPIIAIRGVFLVNGLMMGSFAAHLPLLKARLDLAEGVLGVLLLAMAAGAIAAMLVGGPWLDKVGSRLGLTIGGIVMMFSLPWLAYAPGGAWLAATFVMFGAANGLMDVAMNAHGTSIQDSFHRSIMSSLHGFFSLGGLLAAGVTALSLNAGAQGGTILLSVVIAMAILLCACWPRLLSPADENLNSGGSALAWPTAAIMPIALLCLAAFIGEGAMYDWSAIYLTEVRGTNASTAAWGFGVFSAMMALCRFTGDRIIDRFGRKLVLTVSAGCAIVGYLIALAIPTALATIIGFGFIGLGAANIVPILFATAGQGKNRGSAIAAVATFGYGGALSGPAIIGFLAELTNLTLALGFAGLLLVVVLFGSRRI